MDSDTEGSTESGQRSDKASDFGDFATNEDEEMDIEDLAEPWSRYDIKETQNVFYPICLGDILDERYLVEHKLGAGGGSTVWMAHDLQENKAVALKVMCLSGWGENELRMQQEIARSVKNTSHIATYLATFQLAGNSAIANGAQHRVLVFPLMGPCLGTYAIFRMPLTRRMSAARQLLEALDHLHKAGIVHRDLNERNCMWGMTPVDNLTRPAKYEALGRPMKMKIPVDDLWKEGELVGPLDVPNNLCTEELFLGDFGLSKRLSDPETERGSPPARYCSPERLHGKEPSYACDIWSYMVVFCILYLGAPPFFSAQKDGIIGGMIASLGPLPEEWKGSILGAPAPDSWYDPNLDPNSHLDWLRFPETIAWHRPETDKVEREHVLSLMYKVFTYDPEKRPTATELLHDPSFQAIMEIYGA